MKKLSVPGAVVACVAALLGVWFLGMRNKWAPVQDVQRRINRSVFNPRQMRTAGSPGAYAGIIHHVGRVSGANYDTPVVPFPTEEGLVIVLPYGTRPDWVKNVLAAGGAELTHEGERFRVDSPMVREVRPGDVPASEERAMRAFANTHCLVVRRV